MSSRPVPVPDEQSAPYWNAAAEHVLTAARCANCRQLSLPPDVVCLHCGTTSPDFAFEPVSGRGSVRAWTVVRQSFLPGFEADVPFVLVDVELDEQRELRLIGRLMDGIDAPLSLGARVVTAFEDVAPGVAIPAFALEESA
ncbi:MAG TPA: OB-fold domain-containing protein [Frankiaceae bacterium]|nr:OB-fold domain-containing protein [Frankiaceae bacterium]